MVRATLVSVSMSDAMLAMMDRYKVAGDLRQDVQEACDRLIVLSLRGGGSKDDRDAINAGMIEAIEMYTVAIGVAWTSTMSALEGLGNGHE